MKMTTTWLDSRREPRHRPKERYDETIDGREGLMVRVFPSGAVTFRFRYTTPAGGKRTTMSLGIYGANGLSLADEFAMHQHAQRELEHGLDPVEERCKRDEAAAAARGERADAGTVAEIAEQFVHRKLRAERWDEPGQCWVRDDKNKTKARKRPAAAAVAANRTYSLLSQMFDWAAAKDLIPASPMAGIERPGGEERPRERVLTADEIKTFWSKLDSDKIKMAAPTKLALRLLLLTAQRRGELTQAKWSHFDLDGELWTIPVELLKSSHARRSTPEPHMVPLSPFAIEILRQIKEITGAGTFVLPAHVDTKKERPYSERVLTRAVRKNADHFGIAHFTPHDLRRTAASFMTKLKVPRLHVEKVLNHSTGDIAEVYDRHDYHAEKRAALLRWAEELKALVKCNGTEMPLSVAAPEPAAEAGVHGTSSESQARGRAERAQDGPPG